MPADLATLTGVPPAAVRLAVLHVHDRTGADAARRAAAAQHAMGWGARVVPVSELRAAPGAAVVVLHGPVAGLRGRLALRGRTTTVLAPPAGRWWPRPLGWLLAGWERAAARWANAVLLDDDRDAAVWRRRWVPPFVADDDEARAAVLARAHCYGWPVPGSADTTSTPPTGRVTEGENR